MSTKLKESRKWAQIIEHTEQKIAQTDLKAAQLRSLLEKFRRQEAAGEPSPMELAETAERRVGF